MNTKLMDTWDGVALTRQNGEWIVLHTLGNLLMSAQALVAQTEVTVDDAIAYVQEVELGKTNDQLTIPTGGRS